MRRKCTTRKHKATASKNIEPIKATSISSYRNEYLGRLQSPVMKTLKDAVPCDRVINRVDAIMVNFDEKQQQKEDEPQKRSPFIRFQKSNTSLDFFVSGKNRSMSSLPSLVRGDDTGWVAYLEDTRNGCTKDLQALNIAATFEPRPIEEMDGSIQTCTDLWENLNLIL